MTDTSLATPVTADPILRWTSIAEHARAAHGARWANDTEAINAIIGAFDAILPTGCGYSPVTGVIDADDSEAVPGRQGSNDPPMLACAVASLAVALPECDLEVLHQTETLAA